MSMLSDEAVSRRRVLTAAAGASAVAVLGTKALGSATIARPGSLPDEASTVMVRLGGGLSGVLDLFVGTDRIRIHDADLAARIFAAARPLA
jgi:hypothetical protein